MSLRVTASEFGHGRCSTQGPGRHGALGGDGGFHAVQLNWCLRRKLATVWKSAGSSSPSALTSAALYGDASRPKPEPGMTGLQHALRAVAVPGANLCSSLKGPFTAEVLGTITRGFASKRHPTKSWKQLSSKRGNQNYYKGRGAASEGVHTSRGTFLVLPSRTPRYIVPTSPDPEVRCRPRMKVRGCPRVASQHACRVPRAVQHWCLLAVLHPVLRGRTGCFTGVACGAATALCLEGRAAADEGGAAGARPKRRIAWHRPAYELTTPSCRSKSVRQRFRGLSRFSRPGSVVITVDHHRAWP